MRFGSFVLRPKPCLFTLDAGANVHVLYPETIAAVLQFIKDSSWLLPNVVVHL
jgi:mevalonate pyrophosphate decarboxylase